MVFVRDFKKEFYDIVQHQVFYDTELTEHRIRSRKLGVYSTGNPYPISHRLQYDHFTRNRSFIQAS